MLNIAEALDPDWIAPPCHCHCCCRCMLFTSGYLSKRFTVIGLAPCPQRRGHTKVVVLLLAAGADMNRPHRGDSPLAMARLAMAALPLAGTKSCGKSCGEARKRMLLTIRALTVAGASARPRAYGSMGPWIRMGMGPWTVDTWDGKYSSGPSIYAPQSQ